MMLSWNFLLDLIYSTRCHDFNYAAKLSLWAISKCVLNHTCICCRGNIVLFDMNPTWWLEFFHDIWFHSASWLWSRDSAEAIFKFYQTTAQCSAGVLIFRVCIKSIKRSRFVPLPINGHSVAQARLDNFIMRGKSVRRESQTYIHVPVLCKEQKVGGIKPRYIFWRTECELSVCR